MCWQRRQYKNQKQMNKIESLLEFIKPKLELMDGKVEKRKDNWYMIIFEKGKSIVVVQAILETIQKLAEERPEFEGIAADKFQYLDGTHYIILVD